MTHAYRVSEVDPEIAEILARAVDLHRQGRFADAERAYAAVLAEAPDNVDTLQLLGVLHAQRGEPERGLPFIAAALEIAPASAEIWSKYGAMLEAAGELTKALAAFDKALIIRPSDTEALFNRGNVQMRLRRFQQAAKSFGDVVAIKPDHLAALNCLGTALRILGFREEALANFNRALAIRPNDVTTLKNCGAALQDVDHHDQALACLDKALAADRGQLEIVCLRAVSLRALGRLHEALTAFDAALAANPRHGPGLIGRGNLLHEMGRGEDAIASYDALLAFNPNDAEAHYHRGRVLVDLWRLEEAIASLDHDIEIDPKFAAAYSVRGTALARAHRHDEALASHGQAVALAPDNAEVNFEEGVARLRCGDFAAGWLRYERRLEMEAGHQVASPSWRGKTPLRDQTILLHADQGLGETLQFVRYVPLIVEAGGRFVVEAQAELKELLASTFGPSSIIGRGENPPAHDVNCPLASLPLAFGTTIKTIPAKVPYLRTLPKNKIMWAERLARLATPRVGVAWSYQAESKVGRARSIPLGHFLPLFDQPDVRFVNLQGGLHRVEQSFLEQRPNVVDLGAELSDYVDIAAVVSLLDLVVTIDGPVAHLAGALGRPVWILLPFDADFRWMLNRADSPWYPTARLFRQTTPGDWENVIQDVQRELARGL